ncbi:bromodomain and WD repeat-containing protein 3 isoform X2 [Agrilus planipennis]|uniref:Bromodomain and WD repeat-containing protein 3 isoform X2 n=1 Tax=Agrilus planipennis TaxID=224129 RepID=A0A1W4WUJ9_AGRPL|nr:bromodomain and WD repeat-containing protein 3 isoform X2 [Agrilus planipennis]
METMIKELETQQILPERLDWTGQLHKRTLNDMDKLYPHIGPDYIYKILEGTLQLLEKEYPPTVKGIFSLLGAGQQSLLRGKEQKYTYNIRQYATEKKALASVQSYKVSHNIVNVLWGRKISSVRSQYLTVCPNLYSKICIQRRTLGHLSAVYCLLFDKTGRYILTGADDLLIKLWSSITGRLLATFRGASSEITDIAINLENTLLAAGSIDRILRVWDLQTGGPVAVLSGHTGMITSVNFCPSSRWDIRYLVSTSTDGSVAFWLYSQATGGKANFVSKPVQYQERMRPGQAQMICSSFSPGGIFLATGSADHHVRVYFMRGDEGPHRILETEAHLDRVDSIQWAHRGLRFVSGSKDGSAHIWHFESQQWKNVPLSHTENTEEGKKIRVTMVTWNCCDTRIVTAISDYNLKVWRAGTGDMERSLTGHTDEIYVLEAHPSDPHVVLSAGHDGQLFIWDIVRGHPVNSFKNNLEGQGYGAVFDAKWSPDGTMIAATDSHGHITIFGFGNGHSLFKVLPEELFFHTDYRPLVRDNNHHVLDEQTQVPPHLMPPPFLVDVDGNPYPPMLQRLVPGREHCQTEQLIPNIVEGLEGRQEVIEGLPDEEPYSEIDIMIAALAHRQYGQEGTNDAQNNVNNNHNMVNGNSNSSSSNSSNQGTSSSSTSQANTSNNSSIPTLRRSTSRRIGEGGIRQSVGEWQRDPNIKWKVRVLVQPLKPSELEKEKAIVDTYGAMEMEEYKKEMRRRPIMINTDNLNTSTHTHRRLRHPKKGRITGYRTRANASIEEIETEQPANESESPSSGNSDDEEVNVDEEEEEVSSESSSASESSGYSDWVADQGVSLEPPKRSKRRQAKRVIISPNESEEEKENTKPAVNHVLEKEPRPSTSSTVVPIHIPKNMQKEVPEIYKPSEWLAETRPRKAPYCPQMGDEVVYFRQGHELYIEAVKSKSIYEVNTKDLPWTKMQLKDHEFLKVVGIKYEIRPPRLCCLKLALLDQTGRLSGSVITVKYHDMPGVLDFFVLKQTYDAAVRKKWQSGDSFRCMIEDFWWHGTILSESPYSPDYPESKFMCYEVKWDNHEIDRVSPWDVEIIDDNHMPPTVGEAVPVLPKEMTAILYQPKPEEWPSGDRETACRRIIVGLDKIMALAIAEPFLAPVDLNQYPGYAYIVEYPIDLSTIKARFENRYYRRITSAQFDVRYLATNAEKFNEPHSIILKKARVITELCLRAIKSCSEDLDIVGIYHQLMDSYQSSESDVEVNVNNYGPSTSRSLRSLTTRSLSKPEDWKHEARALLEAMWQCEDSSPFKAPVDHLKHPDYYRIIDTPMDLGTIKEDLLGDNYETPHDFAKDVRLMFQNSKNYNTNKRSRIYAMTIRLSAMFEEHISKIIFNWKQAKRRKTVGRKKSRRRVAKTNVKYNNSDEEDSDASYRRRTATRPTQRSKSRSQVKDTKNGSLTNNLRRSKLLTQNGYAEPDTSDSDTDDSPSDNQPLSVSVNKGIKEKEEKKEENEETGNSSSSNSTDKSSSTNTSKSVKNIRKIGRKPEGSNSDWSADEKLKKTRRKETPRGNGNGNFSLSTRPRREPRKQSDESETEEDIAKVTKRTRTRNTTRKFVDLSDDDSVTDEDDEPLSNLTRGNTQLKNKRPKETDSSASDEGVRMSSRRSARKKPKYAENSDSGTNNSDDNSDDSDRRIVTISSRGRICRLTARARALLKN